MPVARRPHAPHMPCTTEASQGSSMRSQRRTLWPMWSTQAPTKPITTAIHGWTTEQLAVMDTRPARMPLRPIDTSNTPSKILARRVAVMHDTEAAMVVVMATLPATMAAPPEIASVEPQLNPYHPNHRMKTPSDWSVLLPSWSWAGEPSSSKRPVRGPTTIAPTRPDMPPTMCTMPEPAKSIRPLEVPSWLKIGRATPFSSG
mmetsp:Transcript_34905/g.25296  ORF Transcript_34905/g.25296 Transcript_34905/m.25296 type:complete len:202 (+) Transcript_34905:420-1025(+)